MGENIIYSNEFIKLISYPDGVYLETFKKGFPSDQLSTLMQSHPEIEIQSFNVLRNSLSTAPHAPQKIGILKEKITIEVVDNDLSAYIILNLTPQELDMKNRENLVRMISEKLNQMGINTGINKTLFLEELHSGKSYLVAQGTPPENGKDSVITMYKLEESRPELHEDGKVDFYDLKLINRVKAGEWLGERLDATLGKPGVSVKGVPIKPLDGKTIPLSYDRNSVMEIYENQKTSLYSRLNGAVNFMDGKIAVSSHLEIDGDVDFKTGNIKFDGYVTIKGTVTDGFEVHATKDIEINSQLGLGNVKGIVSTQGSIFIKGGIASKGSVEIKAEKNIFTKFVDNAVLTCNGIAHIGFYCINSIVHAGEVIVESTSGKIIGGTVSASMRVIAPTIGSEIEKKTVVEITGFNRAGLIQELDSVFHKISELKNEQQKIKIMLGQMEGKGELSPQQRKEYNDTFERNLDIKSEMKNLEARRKDIGEYLKTRGEGEICITKKMFPNCILHLKSHRIEITSVVQPTSYYIQNDEIKQTT